MTRSAIYESVVRHRRFKPTTHKLRYSVYSLLLDLDEIDDLARRIPILSHNRWNLVSFHDADHGPRDGTALRSWIESIGADAGIEPDGRIELLVFPRILGYTFNPLTVWFIHDPAGMLRAVLYEIHNTFGHSHSHLVVLDATDGQAGVSLRHGFDKTLHVSPFFDQIGRYEVVLRPPDQELSITITYLDEEGDRLLTASQRGSRIELTTRSLLRQFFTKPLLTLKVIAGIHLHAVRLLAKGAKYRPVAPEPGTEIEIFAVTDRSVR
ncbi:MAG: DUF1365 domain-containing protein [Armatimonadetes bacterium]|nr:MAG: DUF1365 domain-containing protein [Armatimonadota bacterium]